MYLASDGDAMKKLWMIVGLSLIFTSCGTTISGADRTKAERYYEYLPICESLPEGAAITAVQLDQIEEQFQTRFDNYEQSMYHIVGESSYMNEINYIFEENLINLQNYSPMVSVLYQHQGEIGMNPVLLMRHVLEGDGNAETEYDSYADRIACVENENIKEVLNENWHSPQKYYSGTIENLIQSVFGEFYENGDSFEIGHTTDGNGDTDMYYVYVIECHEDMECYAYYFYPNSNGVIYQASMDYMLYGGMELSPCIGVNECFAGEGHREEKLNLLEKILDVPPSQEYSGTYDGYHLASTSFNRNYISTIDGKVAVLKHVTYAMQNPDN